MTVHHQVILSEKKHKTFRKKTCSEGNESIFTCCLHKTEERHSCRRVPRRALAAAALWTRGVKVTETVNKCISLKVHLFFFISFSIISFMQQWSSATKSEIHFSHTPSMTPHRPAGGKDRWPRQEKYVLAASLWGRHNNLYQQLRPAAHHTLCSANTLPTFNMV